MDEEQGGWPCFYCGRSTWDEFRDKHMCFACYQATKKPTKLADRYGSNENLGRPLVGESGATMLTMDEDGDVVYADPK